jgi:hypothetical protein
MCLSIITQPFENITFKPIKICVSGLRIQAGNHFDKEVLTTASEEFLLRNVRILIHFSLLVYPIEYIFLKPFMEFLILLNSVLQVSRMLELLGIPQAMSGIMSTLEQQRVKEEIEGQQQQELRPIQVAKVNSSGKG